VQTLFAIASKESMKRERGTAHEYNSTTILSRTFAFRLSSQNTRPMGAD
jgi:hypothetical protein